LAGLTDLSHKKLSASRKAKYSVSEAFFSSLIVAHEDSTSKFWNEFALTLLFLIMVAIIVIEVARAVMTVSHFCSCNKSK
jgi:hypothetical protein